MKNGRKKDNRGLTLIELLVAMTIVTVVVGMAFGFIIHTVRLYSKGNNESSVQNEAQLTMAQIESLVLNANMGIGFEPEPVDPTAPVPDTGNELYLYYKDYQKQTYDEASKTYTDTTDAFEAIRICVKDKKLCYTTMECSYVAVTDPATGTVTNKMKKGDESAPEVLSTFVKNATDFSVDLSNLVKKSEITFKITFDCQGRKYTSKNTIKLRNKVVSLDKDTAGDYFKILDDTSKRDQVTSVVVERIAADPSLASNEAKLWAGTDPALGKTWANPFKATCEYSDGSSDSQVVWSLNPSVTTAKINRYTGMITLYPGCPDTLEVIATSSKSINADKSGDGSKIVQSKGILFVKSVSNATLAINYDPEVNAKAMTGTFTLQGTHLDDSDAASFKPSVIQGKILKPVIGDGTASADGKTISYDVTLNRPVGYENKQYTFELGSTVDGEVFSQTQTVAFSSKQTGEDVFKGIIIIANSSSGESVPIRMYHGSTAGTTVVNAMRGGMCSLQLQAIYESEGTEKYVDVSTDEWEIGNTNTQIAVNDSVSGYTLSYNVEDYSHSIQADITTKYVDPSGNKVTGPTIRLKFEPVSLSIKDINSSQTMFPITRGGTESIVFDVKGINASSLCVVSAADNDLSTTISGNTASVSVKASASSTKTVKFGLKDSKGNVMDGVTCDVRFYPGNPNAYTSSGERMNLYLPLATDISRFDSNKTTPEDNSVVIYTSDGTPIIYSNSLENGDNKDQQGNVHQYWCQYNSQIFYFDARSRQWRMYN